MWKECVGKLLSGHNVTYTPIVLAQTAQKNEELHSPSFDVFKKLLNYRLVKGNNFVRTFWGPRYLAVRRDTFQC
jgi:hypothetical protein